MFAVSSLIPDFIFSINWLIEYLNEIGKENIISLHQFTPTSKDINLENKSIATNKYTFLYPIIKETITNKQYMALYDDVMKEYSFILDVPCIKYNM